MRKDCHRELRERDENTEMIFISILKGMCGLQARSHDHGAFCRGEHTTTDEMLSRALSAAEAPERTEPLQVRLANQTINRYPTP
jgi:hypothetical protein